MTPGDLAVLRELAPRLAGRVGVLGEGLRTVFPRATVLGPEALGRVLARPIAVLVVANTLHTATDPLRAIDTLLDSTDLLVLVEPHRRQRAATGELGNDGDRHRFSVGGSGRIDLAATGAVLAHRLYDGTENEFGPATHLLAVLAGRSALPLFRVDDYPTGVRPIAGDLAPLHAVLETMDDAGVPLTLGVVPALLTEPMSAFLRTLRNLRPAVHGFDHGYPKHSQILIDAGDPLNQRGTVTGFDEFAGHGTEHVAAVLHEARRRVEAVTGRLATTYIPPNNMAGRATGPALPLAGFTRVLSEKPVPRCALPVVASEFYGRSHEAPARLPRVVSLHATWEVDVAREHGPAPLRRFVEQLAEAARVVRERQLALVNALGVH